MKNTTITVWLDQETEDKVAVGLTIHALYYPRYLLFSIAACVEQSRQKTADRPAVQTLQIQEVITCLHSIAQFSHHLHPVSFPRYILAATRPGDLSKY